MNNATQARKVIFRREKGACQCCGVKSLLLKDFQVDHIVPLFESGGELWYYGSENMQLLCVDCHKEKTRQDMIRFRLLKGTSGAPIYTP